MDFSLAIKLKRQGRFEEAINVYREALRRGNHSADVFIGLGKVFYLNGEYKKACIAYLNAFHQIAVFNDILYWKYQNNYETLTPEEKRTYVNNFLSLPRNVLDFARHSHYASGALVLFNNRSLIFHWEQCAPNMPHDGEFYRDALMGKDSPQYDKLIDDFIDNESQYLMSFYMVIGALNHQKIKEHQNSLSVFPLD